MARFDERFDHADKLMNLLVDSVVDYAIFVMDERGYIRTWNRGAERLKGYRPSDIIGRHFSTFYRPEDREAGIPDALLVEAETHGRTETDGWRVRKDGTHFWAHVTITALRTGDDELVGFAKVTRDMTNRHEMEESLRRALAREREAASELQRLSGRRTSFLAAVAHDLTTPIMVIRSCVDLLTDEDETDPQERDQLVGAVGRNAEQLARLAEQLREYSRLDRGKLQLSPTSLELGEMLSGLVSDLGPLLSDVTVTIDGDATVEADALALRRIVTNLLANASAVSPDGGRIRILVRPNDDGLVEVGVEDEGPGLTDEDKDLVFQEFWQGEHLAKQRGSGLGLGLTIVREYVERHGGQAWVDSTVGNGATFWISLPAT